MGGDDLEALIRRAAQGDRKAADALLARFEEPVRRDLHRRLGSDLRARADTEDLLQSTMLAAFEDLGGFVYRDEAGFRAWLGRVAENRIRMAGRFHRQERRDPGRETPAEAQPQPPASATTPSVAAVRGETAGRLDDAVAALSRDERTVVELHSYRGLSFRDVAASMGLANEDAARYLFARALKALARGLGTEA